MRRMKKWLALTLAASMGLSMTACGGSDTADTGVENAQQGDSEGTEAKAPETGSGETPTKMTLILRAGSYGDALKYSLDTFEQENNVEIEVQELSFDDLHTGIALDAVNPEGTYDLCMVDGSWMAEFTENGVLANLSDMGYEFDEDIIEETTSICKVDDAVYLAPFFGNVTVLLYNKELVKAAGYEPENIVTFQDIMEIAKKTQASGKPGFLVRGGSPDNILSDFIPHLLAYGGWVVDEQNQPTVNTEEFKAAMQEYMDLYALGETMDKDDIVAAIDGGNAAMGLAWPGWYVPSADTAANYTVIPTKVTPADTEKNTSMYGIWCIGIPSNAPHKELAMKLLEYVMSPEVQLKSIEAGGVPCRYSALMDEKVLETYPQYQIVCEALQSGVYRPVIAEWTEFTNILGTEMDSILQGVKTMDQGLEEAQSQLEELMAK